MTRRVAAMLAVVLAMVGALLLVPGSSEAGAVVQARKLAQAPVAVTCTRDGLKRTTGIAVRRPKAPMEKRWRRAGYRSQLVGLYLEVDGRNSSSGVWVPVKKPKTTITSVRPRGRTALKAVRFTGLPTSGYSAFRVRAKIGWYNPRTAQIDRRQAYTSASCAEPVTVPSWSAVSASGLPTTAEVLCAGGGGFCLGLGWNMGSAGPHAAAAHWNGSGWAQYDLSSVSSINGTLYDSLFSGGDCRSASDCLAVGRWVHTSSVTDGLAAEWNGASWSRLPDPPERASFTELADASCPQAGYCVVAGYYNSGTTSATAGGLIEVWYDNTWASYDTAAPFGVELNGIDCWAESGCLAVGTNTASSPGASVVHFNGNSPAPVVPVDGNLPDASLSDIACTGSTFCLAVGSGGGKAFVQRWDGAALHRVAMPSAMTSAQTVSCVTASNCVIFGQSAAGAVVAQWNGRTVTLQPGVLNSTAGAVEGSCWSTPAHCLAASSSGALAWRR